MDGLQPVRLPFGLRAYSFFGGLALPLFTPLLNPQSFAISIKAPVQLIWGACGSKRMKMPCHQPSRPFT